MSSSKQAQAIPESQQVLDGFDCGHTINGATYSPEHSFLLPRPILGTCRCGSSSADKGDGVPILAEHFRPPQVPGQSVPNIALNHSGEQTRNRLENHIRHDSLGFSPRIKYISMSDDAIAVQFHVYGVKNYVTASWHQETHTLCIRDGVQYPGPGELGNKVLYAEGLFGEFERSVSLRKYLGTDVIDCNNSKMISKDDGIFVFLPKINRKKEPTAMDAFEMMSLKDNEEIMP